VRALVTELAHIPTMDAEQAILLTRSLIDLSLTGNLLLIVIFSGYENFVSKIHVDDHEDRPSWTGTVDFFRPQDKADRIDRRDQRNRAPACLSASR
jgi:uncharacterized protein (TIGR00645 family)